MLGRYVDVRQICNSHLYLYYMTLRLLGSRRIWTRPWWMITERPTACCRHSAIRSVLCEDLYGPAIFHFDAASWFASCQMRWIGSIRLLDSAQDTARYGLQPRPESWLLVVTSTDDDRASHLIRIAYR